MRKTITVTQMKLADLAIVAMGVALGLALLHFTGVLPAACLWHAATTGALLLGCVSMPVIVASAVIEVPRGSRNGSPGQSARSCH